MAMKKPLERYDTPIIFTYEQTSVTLLQLDPNSMLVTLRNTITGEIFTLPFAHLPKSVKKKIRPLNPAAAPRF